jgi:hypothetical protein
VFKNWVNGYPVEIGGDVGEICLRECESPESVGLKRGALIFVVIGLAADGVELTLDLLAVTLVKVAQRKRIR